MHQEYYQWISPNLDLEMTIQRHGHAGPSLIYFPTSGGKHGEYNYYRLNDDLWPWIEAGRVQIFSVDSINRECWTNTALHPYHRIRFHQGYERYITREVIPMIHHATGNTDVGCFGASFGGYTVANFIFKFPHLFTLGVAMSSTFTLKSYLEGYYDMEVYYSSPTDFLPHVTDPQFFNLLNNHTLFWMFCGDNDICKGENDEFSNLLSGKGIRHWYDRWPAPCDHHEYWWKKMMPTVLDKLY